MRGSRFRVANDCAGKSNRGVESSSSYVVLATSGDDGANWTEKMVRLWLERLVMSVVESLSDRHSRYSEEPQNANG